MGKTKQTPPRRWLGISELEERLHSSRSTIGRWVKQGALASPHYLGIRRLWFEDEVERFEAERLARGNPHTASQASGGEQ